MTRIVAISLAAMQLCALSPAVGGELQSAAPSYIGIMAGAATSLNTNNERFEASSNPYPVVELFGGREIARWSVAGLPVRLDGEARGFWWQQRAHGYYEQSVDGSFMALGVLLGPVVSVELDGFDLFASAGAGGGYQDLDITNGSQDGRDHSERGAAFAWRGAAGVAVPMTESWSVRGEGFYGRAGEIKQAGGGVSLVVKFGGAQ